MMYKLYNIQHKRAMRLKEVANRLKLYHITKYLIVLFYIIEQ